MNEDELSIDIAEEENPTNASDLTDDDLAASLGFMTTISESMLPQPDPMQEMDGEDDLQESVEGTPGKDNEQDKKIAEIEIALEQLLTEENDTTTENTGTEA